MSDVLDVVEGRVQEAERVVLAVEVEVVVVVVVVVIVVVVVVVAVVVTLVIHSSNHNSTYLKEAERGVLALFRKARSA